MLFGWRKRNEGFEWQEYVRTTILVRRADRHKRLDDARLAALAKVKDAKDRGVNAGFAKVEAVRDGAAEAGQRAGHAVAGAAFAGAAKAAGGIKAAAGAFANAAGAVPRPAAPTALRRSAADVAMYAADLPRRWRSLKPYIVPVGGTCAAVFVFGAAFSTQSPGTSNSSGSQFAATSTMTTGSVNAGAGDVVSGRATVTAGDRVRIGGQTVHLAGIEAPHAAQPCFKENGRKWACASSASSALRKLVRGKSIMCELKDKTSQNPLVGHCRAGELDIAAALVRQGNAFASEEGLYSAEEDAARKEKLGIWQGSAERPQDWRNKVWEEAKRNAPDGCPIKGLVRSEGRVYAMPWSEGYAARTIRPVKGERWFCSEDEARSAGFRAFSQS